MLMLMLNEVASYLIVGCSLGLLVLLCDLVLLFSWRMCTLGRDVEVIDDGMLAKAVEGESMNFVASGARLLYLTFQKTEYCSLSVYDNISGFVRWFSAARLQSH